MDQSSTSDDVTESADRLRVPISDPTEVHSARARMRRWLNHRLARDRADEVLLACGEAVDNAIEHGASPIVVELRWDGDEASQALDVTVRDPGTWRVAAEFETRGLGIPIMMALMDSLTIDTTDGTAVRLSRRF